MSRKLISGAKAYLTYFDTEFTTTFTTIYSQNTTFSTAYFTNYITSQPTTFSLVRQTSAVTSAPFITYYDSVWYSTYQTSRQTSRSTQDLICDPYSYDVNTSYTTVYQTQTNEGETQIFFTSWRYDRPTELGPASDTATLDINGNETFTQSYDPSCAASGCVGSNYQYTTTQYYTNYQSYFNTEVPAIIFTTYDTVWATSYVYSEPGATDPANGIYDCYPQSNPDVFVYCSQPGISCQGCTYQEVIVTNTSVQTNDSYPGTALRATYVFTSALANTTWIKSYDVTCSSLICNTEYVTIAGTTVPAPPTYQYTSNITSRITTISGEDCYYSAPRTTTWTTYFDTQYTNIQPTSQQTITTFTTEYNTAWNSVGNTSFPTQYITSNDTSRITSYPVSTSNQTSNQTSWYTS